MDKLKLGDKIYIHVKTRAYTPVSIYKTDTEILRIGPKDLMAPELDLHKKLLSNGFPVPKILAEGEHAGKFYYIEQSLGENLLGDIFWEDCKKDGRISDNHFKSLLELTEKFAEAQLKTVSESRDAESFYIGIHMDLIQEELPELKTDFLKAFEKLKNRTTALPMVLTHGDLNAYNILENGIIDFGNSHYSPAGYDLVGNIHTTHNFPKQGDYETMRRYDFTEIQKDEYFKSMDAIYIKSGLPKLSDFLEDFIFAKTIWSTTRMQRYPKLQKWRYDRLKIILRKYLNDESFMQEALDFK